MKKLLIALACLLLMLSASFAYALEKTTIEIYTLPFGTASYSSDMAMESMFKEIKSPVTLLLKQTPGAMFISRYNFEKKEDMRAGKIPFSMTLTTSAIVPYVAAGLPPYQDYPSPDSRIICALNGVVIPFVTYDAKIKSPADFKGKKVGLAEKARPNQSILPNQPVFDYAYGGFDKVNWQYLGFSNSKDALMNGSIDVHMGNISCKLSVDEKGNLYVVKGTPDPALLEVMSAGKPYYFVSEDPEVLKKAYDPAKHLTHFPVLIKANTFAGQPNDVWVKSGLVVYALDKGVPDDVVEEIVYQMWTHKNRLADYYESFSHMGDSPFPVNVDPKYIHPGLYKAMARLNIPLPAGVSAPQ